MISSTCLPLPTMKESLPFSFPSFFYSYLYIVDSIACSVIEDLDITVFVATATTSTAILMDVAAAVHRVCNRLVMTRRRLHGQTLGGRSRVARAG